MAAQGAFETDLYDRSILRSKHRAYYRSGRHVIKIGPEGALGSYEIRPIHSAPSLGQSIPYRYDFQEFNLDCFNPANGETCAIPIPHKIPLDISLSLLKSESLSFNAMRPDPGKPRVLHGVLVAKEGKDSLCLMGVDEACQEAGITQHVVR